MSSMKKHLKTEMVKFQLKKWLPKSFERTGLVIEGSMNKLVEHHGDRYLDWYDDIIRDVKMRMDSRGLNRDNTEDTELLKHIIDMLVFRNYVSEITLAELVDFIKRSAK
jgi:hypothetical protein